MSFDVIDSGLPFFDDINKQLRNKPFFNSHMVEWRSASNRILPFQLNTGSVSGMGTFSLINSISGVTVDYLAYFTANTTVALVDGEYIYSHLGLNDVVIASGRYYFYGLATGGREFWSEEFLVCSGVTETVDYLLISKTDYLLISGTDKLIIG